MNMRIKTIKPIKEVKCILCSKISFKKNIGNICWVCLKHYSKIIKYPDYIDKEQYDMFEFAIIKKIMIDKK